MAFPHDLADAEAHGVDHAKMDHGFCEKAVPIVSRSALGADVIVRRAVKETSHVLEDEFGGSLDDKDALALGIILVGDAIVESLKNDPLVIL